MRPLQPMTSPKLVGAPQPLGSPQPHGVVVIAWVAGARMGATQSMGRLEPCRCPSQRHVAALSLCAPCATSEALVY